MQQTRTTPSLSCNLGTLPNHLFRYRVPAGLTNSTHLFVWETNRISFQCQTGAYSGFATNLISSWVFTNAAAVPQSGDENVRLNLWLINGNPPTDNNEVEVVIKSFNFVPLGPPPPAVLGNLQMPAAGPFQCDLTAQPDYRYAVQTSSNLLDWSPLTTLLATNSTLRFTDPIRRLVAGDFIASSRSRERKGRGNGGSCQARSWRAVA